MTGDDRFLQLLIADLALMRGLVSASDVGAALMRGWENDGVDAITRELARIADLPDDALAPVREAAQRLVDAADGDARRALTRHGVDRSVHGALGGNGAAISQALTRAHASIRAPLRQVEGDRYTSFLEVGAGAMGVVYMALDTELNRWVAFKLVRPNRGAEGPATTLPPEAERPAPGSPDEGAFHDLEVRFLQEAWITGGLEHPGIVPVHELGQTAGGVPFYTMRLVRGARTLQDAIDEVRDAPVEERLALLEPFLKLCDAVRYAHDKGVVHRDLKPANVALGEYGEAVLLDWGLAKLEGREDLTGSMWQEKIVAFREAADMATLAGAMGTPGYMAPEAALGRVEAVDVRSDVYSLGALLYEILTGRLPFQFDNYMQMVYKLASLDPPTAHSVDTSVPTRLSELCAEALARDPADRPESAEALAERIRHWQTESALEREVEGLIRDATAALGAAESATGAGRLPQVDRALAALGQIAARQPANRDTDPLAKRASQLRETGIRESERTSVRRVLVRVGVGVLAFAAVAAALWAVVYGSKAREAERARTQLAERNRQLEAALTDAQTQRTATERLRAAAEHEARYLQAIQDWKTATELLDEDEGLWPIHPDRAPAMARWLTRAGEALARRDDHLDSLEALRLEASREGSSADVVARRDTVEELLTRLEQIRSTADVGGGRLARIAARHGQALELRLASVEGQGGVLRKAWDTTIERVATSPLYAGLRIVPQLGLVPLGPDPESDLFEFAHLGSGSIPTRDPITRRLSERTGDAIVLVLIPGGTLPMGAQTDEATANYDPDARPDESPVHLRELAPYLIGKHEVTQGQWAKLTGGETPSKYLAGQSYRGRTLTDRHPVEEVSWDVGKTWLSRHRLTLPTEAQWEYACRARTDTPWYSGRASEDLGSVANVADRFCKENGGSLSWAYSLEVDDGHAIHAPVGSFRPNTFGLHDMHGNLWEWCLDVYRPYGASVSAEGKDGRANRGGGWNDVATLARSASRDGDDPSFHIAFLGVRAAAPLASD